MSHNGPITDSQRLWITVFCAGKVAYLAGNTALELAGLRNFRPRWTDALVPSSTRPGNPPAGVRIHRTTQLPEQDRRRINGLPCTSTARALVDAAAWAASDDAARTLVAMTFQQGLVREADVVEVLDRMRTVRRHALIAETVSLAAGGAHSLGEIDFLRLCRGHQLPTPELQVSLPDSDGRKRYLDAVFQPWGVWVEIDGRHHLNADQWWADLHRQNALWTAGHRILRFPAWVVRDRPHEVAAQIRLALAAAEAILADSSRQPEPNPPRSTVT